MVICVRTVHRAIQVTLIAAIQVHQAAAVLRGSNSTASLQPRNQIPIFLSVLVVGAVSEMMPMMSMSPVQAYWQPQVVVHTDIYTQSIGGGGGDGGASIVESKVFNLTKRMELNY